MRDSKRRRDYREKRRGRERRPLRDAVRRRFFEKAKQRVQKALSRKDASIVQGVRALDDLDSVKALLFQRLDEWVKTNFPEFRLKSDESACQVFARFGCKEALAEKEGELAEIVGSEKASELVEKARQSYGVEFDEKEREAVKALARRILELFEARRELQEFVEQKTAKNMPNISFLVEPLLAARLTSTAGGLERLAQMPASTIQVIGAEKALFKHLRSGTNPPKHGIIFQSPLINAAPLKQRGKIARALATKLSIAAKADFFTGNFIAKKLKAILDKRLKQIRGNNS